MFFTHSELAPTPSPPTVPSVTKRSLLLLALLGLFATTVPIVVPLDTPLAAPRAAHAPIKFLRSSRSTHALMKTSCPNLDCPSPSAPLRYAGGLILDAPKVYFVQLSTNSSSLSPPTGFIPGTFSSGPGSLVDALSTMVGPTPASWLTEYSDPASGQLIGPGTYAGTLLLNAPTLATSSSVDDSDISLFLQNAANQHQLPDTSNNAVYVLFFRANQTVTVTAQGIDSVNNFCAYHSAFSQDSTEINYIVMPNESDNSGCANVGLTASALDNFTPSLSHEITETITDPWPNSGWTASDGSEIGDLCEVGWPVAGYLSTASSSYAVQFEYSNLAGACINQKDPSTLTSTYSLDSPATVTATLSASGQPVPGAEVYLVSEASIVDTATTSSSGMVTFRTSADPSTLRLFYAGSSTLNGQVVVPSAASSTTTTTTTPPPTVLPPTKVSISPAPRSLKVSWVASATPAVSSYVATATPSNASCATSTTSCTITGLTNATSYSVSVVARTSSADSVPSVPVPATAAAVPDPPDAPQLLASSGQISVLWKAPPTNGSSLTSYSVSASPGLHHCIATAPTTSCTIASLTNGTNYSVSVVANSNLGPSLPSPPSLATPVGLPSAVSNLAATPARGSLVVTWANPGNTGGLALTRTSVQLTPPDASCVVPATLTSCTLNNLSSTKSYIVAVTTANAKGPSLPAQVIARPLAALAIALVTGSTKVLAGSSFLLTVTGADPFQPLQVSDSFTKKTLVASSRGQVTTTWSTHFSLATIRVVQGPYSATLTVASLYALINWKNVHAGNSAPVFTLRSAAGPLTTKNMAALVQLHQVAVVRTRNHTTTIYYPHVTGTALECDLPLHSGDLLTVVFQIENHTFNALGQTPLKVS